MHTSMSMRRSRARAHGLLAFAPLLLALAVSACSADGTGDTTGPGLDVDDPLEPPDDGPPDPGPGPHFTVLPIPLDSIARIDPLGHNNKVIPIDHSYWHVCDNGVFLAGGQCNPGRYPIRSPADGVVWAIDPGPDGNLTIQGPPGVYVVFGHVTPAPGLAVGQNVAAGDTVGQMYTEHNFDFGVVNDWNEPHRMVAPERYPHGYIYAEHPIAQYPEPLRSQLEAKVRTFEDPLGRLDYDVAGTAQGNWFKEGAPAGDAVFMPVNWHNQLYLGPLAERHETRIIYVGEAWSIMTGQRGHVDPSAPSWNEITPASGVVSLRLWLLDGDGRPRTEAGYEVGTVLIEMLAADRLRIEWFATHDPVADFTEAARIYVR